MLTQRPDGLWEEVAPSACPRGHRVRPNRVLVGWDGTKRVYQCLECAALRPTVSTS